MAEIGEQRHKKSQFDWHEGLRQSFGDDCNQRPFTARHSGKRIVRIPNTQPRTPTNGAVAAMLTRLYSPRFISPWTAWVERTDARLAAFRAAIRAEKSLALALPAHYMQTRPVWPVG